MGDDRMLGLGIYDAVELSRIVRRSANEVAAWSRATDKGDALLQPRAGRLFSFYDLVTAEVTAELLRRQVPLWRIRDARRFLFTDLSTIDGPVEWPLAHAAGLHRLASLGTSVYFSGDDSDWLDASQGGQAAFQEVVVPLVKRLEFNEASMASVWHPATGVVINPRVQAGAPVIEGTRISTQFLADLVSAGEDLDDIAADYDLASSLLRQALDYEADLAA